MICPNPKCIKLEIRSNEIFCPWCGQRCDNFLRVEEKLADKWVEVQRFFIEERPTLRLALYPKDGTKSDTSATPVVHIDCKWLRVAQGNWDGNVWYADLKYLPDQLLNREIGRSYTANISLDLPNFSSMQATLRIYPRPTYDLEVDKDKDGIVSLLKDEQGFVHLNFAILRYGSTMEKNSQARIPSRFLADSSNDVNRASRKNRETSDTPNLWGDCDKNVRSSSESKELLWNEQSIPINWNDKASCKRRSGNIIYKVRAGDSEVYNITLTLSYRGRIGSDDWRPHEFFTELVVKVRILGCPILKILDAWGSTVWSVLTNRREDFITEVQCTNVGQDSTLNIKSVSLDSVPSSLSLELEGDIVEGVTIVNVAGKAPSPSVRIKLLAEPPVGYYKFNIAFTYINPKLPKEDNLVQHKRLVCLRVGAPELLPGGVVAIDFGTSSSCVSVIGLGERNSLIEVGTGEGDPFSLPSLALYAKYKVIIGHRARLLSYKHPLALIEAPKREIGKCEYFEVLPIDQSWVKIPIGQVIENFYRVLLERVQDKVISIQRQKRGNWTQCIFENISISCPSRFNFLQKQVLVESVHRAFEYVFGCPCVHLELVQEPLAAALTYIDDTSVQEYWHKIFGKDTVSYSVLVYDCGGGTTDLCCLEVCSRRNLVPQIKCEDYSQITPEHRDILLPKALKRLIPNLSQEQINSWSAMLKQHDNWIWAWDEYPELKTIPCSSDDIVESIMACANERSETFGYTVTVHIRGASGDPTFGGNDVTDEIADIIKKRFEGLIVDEDGDSDNKIKARRNSILLRSWAEIMKCHICDSDPSFIVDMINSNKFGALLTCNGPIANERLREELATVYRGLYKKLRYANGGSQTRIANLGDECLSLVRRCLDTEEPNVILLTGRGSRWPGISESLRQKFSDKVKLVSWKDGEIAKHCVAQGSGMMSLVRSGAKLTGGTGVHIVAIDEDIYATSSLCLQCGSVLEEIIGAGSRLDKNNVVAGEHLWFLGSQRKTHIKVYRSDIPGTCQLKGNDLDYSGAVCLGTFEVCIDKDVSGTEAKVLCELHRGREAGWADLRVFLRIGDILYSGKIDSDRESLPVMILNK